ncbi:hypothetical protein K2Q02_02330 [Patescibacteria group bacterium]|nr:hypothetical protein [Patescibacteria group bacterium]
MPSAFTNLVILIIVAPILAVVAWHLWLSYIQSVFLGNIKWVLLEIKPPKDVFKSPLAMELVLGALFQAGGTSTWFDRYWKGQVRNFFSLEIVSTEGSIRFYIRTSNKFQKLIESQIYAQYPQAEVREVEDYTTKMPSFDKDSKDNAVEVWGFNPTLAKDEVYPIKTYIDFGLDKAVGSLAEEERIDPITPTLEFMGSIGAHEHIWLQFIVRAATKRFTVKNSKGIEEKAKEWFEKSKEIIQKFNESLVEKDDEGKKIGSRRATKGELGVIESIERNANKLGFDSGARAVYVTDKGHFDANRIPGILGMLRQYGANDYNSFKPSNVTGGHDFPWQDLVGKKTLKQKDEMYGDYKARSFFYGSFYFDKIHKYFTHPNESSEKQFILSAEELATVFHLPGRVAETPSFERIESKKGEAPGNLPI